MNASTRFGTGLVMALALVLVTGCSSGLDGGCETCDVPAPEPACAPPPVADCAPPPVDCAPPLAAVPVAANRPPATNAAPGQVWCYVKVPAVVKQVPERICVRPPTTQKEWVPAVQQQVAKRVCIRPPSARRIPIPAQYEERTQQICVDPGRTEWAKVKCATVGCTNPQEELGECWQLQQIPPTYETKVETICTRQQAFREEQVPGEYAEQLETVTVKPGFYRDVPIEGVYEERVQTVVVSPARWEWRRNNVCEVPGAQAPFGATPVNQAPMMLPDTMLPDTMPRIAPDTAPAVGGPVPNVLQPQPAAQPFVPAPAGNPQAAPTPVNNELPPAGALPPVPDFDDK